MVENLKTAFFPKDALIYIGSMNKMNTLALFPVSLVFAFLISLSANAQDYKLLSEGFENKDDSSWFLRNASKVEFQSYRGQRSAEIKTTGEAFYLLDLPEGTQEIVVRGWIKLVSSTTKNFKSSNNYISGDTVVVSGRSSNRASLAIESADPTLFLKEGLVGMLTRNAGWTNFEKEIRIPKGLKRIKILCKNNIENATAYFDEIEIEKRQIGFVKQESSWARAVRENNEKAKLLVKNGDFEEGGAIWNQYWGFQLSDIAHSGKYACTIQNSDSGAWRGSGNDKLFKIPPGTTKLKVSVWIKADHVVGGPNAWETGAILLSFADSYGNEVPGGDAVARTVGTHDWRKFETYFNVSERATQFKVLLQLAASTGKIYFDDIVAEPMTEEEFYKTNIVLKNPGFENLLSGWPTYAGEATKEEAHTGEYSLKVAGKEAAWEMRMQTLSLVRDKKELTLNVWIKTVDVTETPNSWEGARVFIEFQDINGISLNTENVGRAVGNTDWQKFTATIAIPEDAVSFTISCGRANVAGKAYFDDVSLEYPVAK